MKTPLSKWGALLLLSSSLAFAHGEDKPGPHGGLIGMPGAYHTELVPMSKNEMKVYLLDMNWKNPTVRDSSVVMKFSGTEELEAKCEKKKNAFVCRFDQTVDLNSKGKLVVGTTRENKTGSQLEYATPLKH